MKHCSLALLLLALGIVGGCSDSDGDLGPEGVYEFSTSQTALTIGQDSTRQLAVTVTRDDTVPVTGARITYLVDDLSVAAVSATGLVTAKKGGQTNVRAAFNGDTLVIPLTVVPRPATSVTLTLNFTGKDSGTVFALPGRGPNAFLRAEVKAGDEIVYCNALACANHATRTQRIVEFSSLNPAKAVIANSTASGSALNARGQVTATDTSNTPVGFVLRVPADNIADTVWLKLALRPIDSITVRPDSFTVAGTTTRIAFTNNVTRDSSIVLAISGTSRSDSSYSLLSSGTQRATISTVDIVRPSMPRVTWESANGNYAVVDNQGRVTGLRTSWFGGTNAATNDVPSCSSAVFKVSPVDTAYFYDRVLTNFRIPTNFTPAIVATGCPATTGNPPVATNVPASVARGVNCVSATSTTAAYCTVVIRATITDPATNVVRRAHFVVNVRQP